MNCWFASRARPALLMHTSVRTSSATAQITEMKARLAKRWVDDPVSSWKEKARLNSEFGKLYLSLVWQRLERKILCDGRFCGIPTGRSPSEPYFPTDGCENYPRRPLCTARDDAHKNVAKTHVLKKHYSSRGTRNQLASWFLVPSWRHFVHR